MDVFSKKFIQICLTALVFSSFSISAVADPDASFFNGYPIYPCDTAPMERFFRSLKSEWVPTGYSSFNQALASITQYIVGYYSQHRPHQHNGGLPPNKAEAKCNLVSKAVVSFT
jgi:hypothetical protein